MFEIDLESHQVRSLFGDPATPVRSLVTLNDNRPSPLFMLTDEAIYIVDPDRQRRRFPLPPEVERKGFTVAIRPDGDLTIAVYARPTFGSLETHVSIYVLAADGTLGPPRDVTLETSEGWPDTELCAAAFVSPALQLLVNWPSNHEWRRYEGVHSSSQYAKLVFWRERWWLVGVALAGAVLATICYRRQTRYQVPVGQRILWSLFVFLFGIPGWIGYRYCRRWPVLEPCPACHRPSPRADEIWPSAAVSFLCPN